MAFHKVIGIDLGTTYSTVSIWDHDRQEIVVIPSVIGSNTIPSVVGLDLDCNIIVGAPAQNAFFSQESLIEFGDADFRRAIDRALDQSKHMIVVTSSREYAESPWVRAEWGLFY